LSETKLIETVALAHIEDARLLLVRRRGNGAFYMPGGKPGSGEARLAALRREVYEELGARIAVTTLRSYGVFEDLAYGQAAGVRVRIACYLGKLTGAPQPRAEITEIRYFRRADYDAMADTAPAVHGILRDLQARGLIG
jgi:8-oxo-dGTP diphosphatase